MRTRLALLGVLLLSCTGSVGDALDDADAASDAASEPPDARTDTVAPDAAVPPAPDAGLIVVPTTTVAAQRANNTSASTLFVDDYRNFATSAQSGSSNGDAVPGAVPSADPATGVVSKVPLRTLLNPGAATRLIAETQTWFCHLASNEDRSAVPPRLKPSASCGSHIDVGYNSDDPARVKLQLDDMQSRGLTGVVMDWSGRTKGQSNYPTTTSPPVDRARGSTEVGTNAIWAFMKEAEKRSGFLVAVMEDEGITNCRKGWAGGCACWPAAGTTCDETTQVISDLNYVGASWTKSPAYWRESGKAVVFFFAPDYNACPDANAADCQRIDWAKVKQFAPQDQLWIFQGKSGFSHASSGGGFSWAPVPGLYPQGDPSFGLNYLADFDGFVTASGNVATGQLVVGSAFKGFDDGVTNGWTYDASANHTRYINQRCGQTFLDTLAKDATYFDRAGRPALPVLQLVTWDDYEEATELETGIDNCVKSLDASVDAGVLTWSITFGASLTDASIQGSENTVDHYEVFVSSDGQGLMPVGGPLGRDGSGKLPKSFDVGKLGLAKGRYQLFVKAVGRPFMFNRLSAPVMYDAP